MKGGAILVKQLGFKFHPGKNVRNLHRYYEKVDEYFIHLCYIVPCSVSSYKPLDIQHRPNDTNSSVVRSENLSSIDPVFRFVNCVKSEDCTRTDPTSVYSLVWL